MKVNSIEIKNVKSFKTSTKIDLNDDYNFAVGTNGSGKTTLLQILGSCLFHIVPLFKPQEAERGGGDKRLLFAGTNQNVFLPKNYELENEEQIIVIELSIESSIKSLIEELNSYKELFIVNQSYIQDSYFDQENMLDILEDNINYLKGLKSFNFIFKFKVESSRLNFVQPDTDAENSRILKVFQNLEIQRNIYNYLFRTNKTEKVISQGFRIIYLNADRIVNFPAEIQLNRGNVQQFHTNTAYSQYADVMSSVFSNNSFNYISQTLGGIGERYIYQRWSKHKKDAFNAIGELTELKRLIKQLLDLELVLEETVTPFEPIKIFFKDNSKKVEFNQLSSGEKTLVYFIFIIANPDIKNSFILIDEAEIHLHSSMQDTLLNILFSKKLNNQHFITTHSPKLINRRTISSVLRLYKEDKATSYIKFKDSKELGHAYNILRLINSQNNEKVFFADTVVLVEGIKDRILIESIINKLNDTKNVVEVIDVGGKKNLALYKDYLDKIKVRSVVLADFDHLIDLKKVELKELLKTNKSKIDDILKRKKSKDRKAIVDCIEEFLQNDDKNKLRRILAYLKTRGITLKSGLNKKEIKKIQDIIEDSRKEGIFIISSGLLSDDTKYSGEIEDYLVGLNISKADIKELVQQTGKDNFVETLLDKSESITINELFTLVSIILYDDPSKSKNLINRVKNL